MNIANHLENATLLFPDRTAVIDGECQLTYGQFNREANRVGSALVKRGIKPGDHVALCAPNSWRWLMFYFGAVKAGAVAATFSHLMTASELHTVISDCRPKILFTTDDKRAALVGLKDGSDLAYILCDRRDMGYDALVKNRTTSFSTVTCDRNDTAAILYTGGTTGIPKGALLSHENLQTSIGNVARNERSTETDRVLCFLPLNHVFAQVHIMLSTVYTAGSLVLLPAFDMNNALDAIKRHNITKFYAVPTVYIRLLGLNDLPERFRSIRYCFSAAASMAAETVRAWKEKTGLDIYEAYGMTESASMVTYNHYYRHVVGSVGTPVNRVGVEIRDVSGRTVSPGNRGEICIKGPNIARGYLNNPKETESAFRQGWFHSGDIGRFDDNGYLYIVDRLKDMIITGGENVYPREVEEVLYTHPGVLECAVIGLPDEEYGERVTAFIVPQKNQEIDPDELKSFLKTYVSPFKVPKAFLRVDELPKNNAGKLLKRELKKQYQSLSSY